MNGLRKHFTVGLVLILCALTGHCSQSAPSVAPVSASAGRGAQRSLRRIVEIMRRMEENRSRHRAKTESPQVHASPVALPAEQPQDLLKLKMDRRHLGAGVMPRDPKKKIFIKHITGPLTFSPKCRKQVYRLYHQRDCTTPAFYKRCARLLTQLARQQCTEG